MLMLPECGRQRIFHFKGWPACHHPNHPRAERVDIRTPVDVTSLNLLRSRVERRLDARTRRPAPARTSAKYVGNPEVGDLHFVAADHHDVAPREIAVDDVPAVRIVERRGHLLHPATDPI